MDAGLGVGMTERVQRMDAQAVRRRRCEEAIADEQEGGYPPKAGRARQPRLLSNGRSGLAVGESSE